MKSAQREVFIDTSLSQRHHLFLPAGQDHPEPQGAKGVLAAMTPNPLKQYRVAHMLTKVNSP
jgi:hypothetical protein